MSSSKQKALRTLAEYGGTWQENRGAWLEVTVEAPNGKIFREHGLHGVVAVDGNTMEQCWKAVLDDLTTSDGNLDPFSLCEQDDCDVCETQGSV